MRSALTILLFAAVLCLFVLGQGIAAPPIRFEEIAERAGVHLVVENSPTPEKHQPETMPAGVALFDYDRDGLLDIYLVNGAEMPSLQKTGPGYYNRLFHNNGNGTFTDVTEQARVAGAGYGMGVAVGDYDNDGRPDLFVANVNGNQLFHNNGDGTFTDVTAKAVLSGALHHGRKMWSVAAGWFDYNRDGLLDLFVVNYCDWDPRYEPSCMGLNGGGYCHPIGPRSDGTIPDEVQHVLLDVGSGSRSTARPYTEPGPGPPTAKARPRLQPGPSRTPRPRNIPRRTSASPPGATTSMRSS